MSRNLCETSCVFCNSKVSMVEEPRPIERSECGVYFGEYEGMLVANAECTVCLAKYLAWVDERTRINYDTHGTLGGTLPPRRPAYDTGFCDLSHRSTFNDEPGFLDLPEYDIEKVRTTRYWRVVVEK